MNVILANGMKMMHLESDSEKNQHVLQRHLLLDNIFDISYNHSNINNY